MTKCKGLVVGIGFVTAMGAGVQGAHAADEPARSWSNVTELGLVMTTGNSEATNFAFGNKYAYKWTNAEFTVDAQALRSETTTRFITATDGVVSETNVDATNTEFYALAAKYRRDISKSFFWFARAGWLRNQPSGIDTRLAAGGGLGYTFFKSDTDMLAGEFGVEYTDEQYTSPTFIPGRTLATDSTNFATARGFLGYERKIGAASKFNGELEAWENLKETSDWRARAMAAITASLTDRLALKAAYTVFYDAEPVVVVVPDSSPVPLDEPGRFAFDDVDTVFTATLVITY